MVIYLSSSCFCGFVSLRCCSLSHCQKRCSFSSTYSHNISKFIFIISLLLHVFSGSLSALMLFPLGFCVPDLPPNLQFVLQISQISFTIVVLLLPFSKCDLHRSHLQCKGCQKVLPQTNRWRSVGPRLHHSAKSWGLCAAQSTKDGYRPTWLQLSGWDKEKLEYLSADGSSLKIKICIKQRPLIVEYLFQSIQIMVGLFNVGVGTGRTSIRPGDVADLRAAYWLGAVVIVTSNDTRAGTGSLGPRGPQLSLPWPLLITWTRC